jgi:hypothetical protein
MEERNQLPSSVTAWLQGWQWARHEASTFFLPSYQSKATPGNFPANHPDAIIIKVGILNITNS